jgi:CubicO group peptidase (beta-lactamase class C family)
MVSIDAVYVAPELHLPQNPPPAGAWWYSNVGYALLGMALANRASRPYEVLLQARVIDPLGLRDATFYPTPARGLEWRRATILT